ncbi:MAG: hypothetical protein EXR07_02530 [Acetobacteraceae bacterium]|nr:hypothetical protein [Acetobacteraceae bacterium]
MPNTAIQPAVCHEALVIHRCITRSQWDWQAKLRRGNAMFDNRAPDYEPPYDDAVFDYLARDADIKDDTIKRFAPKVRALLAGGAQKNATRGETQTHGNRPTMPHPGELPQTADLNVLSRIIRLEPGIFALSLTPGPFDPTPGLPGVRVSLPPGPPGQRETVAISAMRGDGWMTATDEPTLLRAAAGGGRVMVTLYWIASGAPSRPPDLKLERLNPEAAIAPRAPGNFQAGMPGGPPAPITAEVVAHVQGLGDVEAKFGDWIGQRGAGRAIEGFSLAPRMGITPDDFELRAVLGRDWLSPWLPGGHFCGSRGLALPLRGFCLRLRGPVAARYDFACFARFVDGSETGPVGSGQICAAPSLAPLEAFQIALRPRAFSP